MKHIALLISAVIFLGIFITPVLADCTEADVHNAVAQWADVPLSEVTDTTYLDGLGNKAWPEDAPSLIADIEQLCGCEIPAHSSQGIAIIMDPIGVVFGIITRSEALNLAV